VVRVAVILVSYSSESHSQKGTPYSFKLALLRGLEPGGAAQLRMQQAAQQP